jgi:opacity protein-like surface antigen
MKIFDHFGQRRRAVPVLGTGAGAVLAVAALALCLAMARAASAQVVPSADAGGLAISAGGAASGYTLQYGQRKMLGITGFVDVDTRRRLGIEAETRWLEFHQTANVHAETYSAGARYRFNFGRFQPYAKAMIGFGDFNFPYNYARGSYLVSTAGGGLDYRFSRRIHIRIADVEYQDWPQFTYGAMTSLGVSVGLRVRVF